MKEFGEFKMKFKEIADEIFEQATKDINKENRPSLFILIKDMKNGKIDVKDVFPVYDPDKRKETGEVVSIRAYKSKIDLILFISETKNTLTMVYTESDGKSALKIGVKDKTPSGTTYIEDSAWTFNATYEQYVFPWNEENRLVIEQMIKNKPPLELIEDSEDSEIMDVIGDVLKSLASTHCQCEKCKRERGEILESGDSVHGNFDNILNKLEVPNDKNKIN
jgi:hypothetical protein